MKTLLLSGGRESTYIAAKLRGELDQAIFFDYGQPHGFAEYRAARRVAKRFDLPLLYRILPSMPMTRERFVVPHRNLVMLTVAASQGATELWLGANATDYELFPDCRRPYLDSVEALLGVPVHTPLVNMKKSEISEKLECLGVPLDDTWSCYFPVKLGGFRHIPCEVCPACLSFND